MRTIRTARFFRAALLSGSLLLAGAQAGYAQLNSENFAKLGFNFNPPGARSAALGGAFIPLADDATAAETNPAGLTVLLYPQLSFEYKGVEYTRTLPEQAGGGEFTDNVGVPSFASAVLPLGGVTLAAFRHELVNYRSNVSSTGWDFGGGLFLLPYTSELDLKVQNYGGAIAVKLGPLSLGAAGGASLLTMEVDFPRYRITQFEDGFIDNRLLVQDADGEASGFFVNGGVLLRLGERVSLGGVYKRRPTFDGLHYQVLDRTGTLIPQTPSVIPEGDFELKIPDSWGGGLAVRPHELLTLTFSGVVNRYSQLADESTVVFTHSVSPALLVAKDYVADDGVDYHAGAELVLLVGQTPLALRVGGASLAPSNTFYNGVDPIERRLWGTEPGERTTQFSAGVGLVLLRKLQFDGAALAGDDRRELVGSLVILF